VLYYYFLNREEKSYSGDTLKFSALDFVKRLLNVCFGGVSSKGIELKFVRLTSLARDIDQINKRFERGRQQDAMAFLRSFVQRLTTEINPCKPEATELSRLFSGLAKRTISCPACKFDQEIEESFLNVGLAEGFEKNLRQAR